MKIDGLSLFCASLIGFAFTFAPALMAADESDDWFALARRGESGALVERLDEGQAVDARDPGGRTALMHAAYNGHEATVRMLVRRGADVNLRGGKNYTPLMYAAFKDREGLVRFLIEKGADYSPRSTSGRTALRIARELGHRRTLRYLRTEYLGGLLNDAAERRRWSDVRELLADGADPNLMNDRRETLLERIVEHGDEATLAAMLRARPDLKMHGGRGNAHALSLARERDRKDGGQRVKQLLAVRYHMINHRRFLHRAVLADDLEFARLLLDHRASPDLIDVTGDTPLHLAAGLRSTAMATLLLDRGAPPRVLDRRGYSPLGRAVERKNAQMAELLIARGGSRTSHRKEVNPLWIAVNVNAPEIARRLLKAGVDVHRRSPGYETPILHASRIGRHAMIELLIDAGAKVREANAKGTTPLLALAYGGGLDDDSKRVRSAERLIGAGARINHNGHHGRNALWWAACNGQGEMVRFLLKHGARPVADASDLGPADVAQEQGHARLAGYLRTLEFNKNPAGTTAARPR